MDSIFITQAEKCTKSSAALDCNLARLCCIVQQQRTKKATTRILMLNVVTFESGGDPGVCIQTQTELSHAFGQGRHAWFDKRRLALANRHARIPLALRRHTACQQRLRPDPRANSFTGPVALAWNVPAPAMPPRPRLFAAHDQKLAEIKQKRNQAQQQLQSLRAEQRKDTHLHAVVCDSSAVFLTLCTC